MTNTLTRRERRRICRDYYRKCRKGWLNRIRRSLLVRIRGDSGE